MDYKIEDLENKFSGEIVENLGNSEYIIKIDGKERNLKIINMDSTGIEFILDQKYHKAKYLESSTAQMNLVVDNVPFSVKMHADLNEIVYKYADSAGPEGGASSLLSQIPGKVISFAVEEGSEVKKGDPVCTLESMKMQVSVKAHRDGTVKSIRVKQGASVAKSDVILDIE